MWRGLRVFCGFCPDPECKTKLYFPSYAASSIECTGCGQHHAKETLVDVHDVRDPDMAMQNLLRSALLSQTSNKSTELVKVKGYSNYHCKLLSPLFTSYGMDKLTGKAKLLSEMGQGDTFDCSVLCDRAFQLEQEHLETSGYGRDKTGSQKYLQDTLKAVEAVNGGEDRLIPLHVDGDGHCLVHAISRALVGREIFWHALRANLKVHLEVNLQKYKALLKDFIDDKEWKDIIVEADPNYRPGEDESMGLRNIHIFALANVLHRPIVLLDGLSGMQSSGDYSGLFLPALVPVHKCISKDGHKHKPLAIAWSSSGRNHYVPLVAIKGKLVPKLPQWLVPKAWGVPDELIRAYVDLDSSGNCCIGGDRCIQDKYIQRLIRAMDEMFLKQKDISALLVTEVHQFVYKPSGLVGVLPVTVVEAARVAVREGRLRRCLSCNILTEHNPDVQGSSLCRGGALYMAAFQIHGRLEEGATYTFPNQQGLSCVYDAKKDILVPVKHKNHELLVCHICKGPLRQVKADNSLVYINGDRTTTPVSGPSRCGCGFKHFWDGKEYNNLPERFPVLLEWGGQTFRENAYWFQYENDPSLNSNVYDVASNLVQKHFPGEFGSERLVQKVVDILLRYTAKREGENRGAMPDVPGIKPASTESDPLRPGGLSAACFQASKSIMTGEKHQTFHREELTLSDAERAVKARTEQNAAIMQKRRTVLEAKKNAEKNPKMPEQQGKALPTHGRNSPSSPIMQPQPTSPRQTIVRKDKKIRLSTVDGRQVMLTLKMDTTFRQLQISIEKELDIAVDKQKIRHGFPPRELHPPECGKEDDPVPLQHGDKVMVEQLLPPEPDPTQDVSMDDEGKEKEGLPEPLVVWEPGIRGSSSGNVMSPSQQQQQQGSEQNAQLAAALMNALTGALSGDMFEAAQKSPHLFEKGGKYYNKVQQDLGPLTHDKHCTIPFFPGKVFAYNGEKDRLELCLGQVHVPIQPGMQIPKMDDSVPAQTPVAQTGQPSSQTSHAPLSSDHSFSGAIQQKDKSHSRVAFSGQGRSLVSPATSGQTLRSESKTSETRSSSLVQSSTHQEESRDASVGQTSTQISFKETKTNGTSITSTAGPMKDRTQVEILDIEMRSPEELARLPTSQVDIAAPENSEAPQQMDTGTISASPPACEGEQKGEGRCPEKSPEGATGEGQSTIEEEKMDTEMSGSEKTVVVSNSSSPSIVESNQFVPEVKMKYNVHAGNGEKEDSLILRSSHSGNATGGPGAVVCRTNDNTVLLTEKEASIITEDQADEFVALLDREGETSIVGVQTADTTQSATTALGTVGFASKLNTTVAVVDRSSVVADSATLASFDGAEPVEEERASEGQNFRSCDLPSEQKGTRDIDLEK